VLRLREDVFSAVIHNDLSFFDQHPSGKVVSRVTSDTQDFSEVVTLTMSLLSQVLLVAILAVWLLNINAWLTLLLVAAAWWLLRPQKPMPIPPPANSKNQ